MRTDCLTAGVVVLFCAVTSWGATMRILPLGDSITQGNDHLQTYRYDLWKDLLDANYDFEFVGSMTTNFGGNNPPYPDYLGQTFSDVNEGHYGWKIHEINDGAFDASVGHWGGSLSDWITGYTADIALVHLGTNDVTVASSADMVAGISQIIDTLRTNNPHMAILLGAIPASGFENPPYGFNQGLAELAAAKDTPESRVLVVDLTTGWISDPSAPGSHTWDWVHPNPLGESELARRFADAILFAIPEPSSLGLVALLSALVMGRKRG